MTNPWLRVPLPDYEAHMDSANVGQLKVLDELFGEALAWCKPSSVAVLGVAGGNGLARIENRVTKRVVGVDMKLDYLSAVRKRYEQIPRLELYCADLAAEVLEIAPVEMVHAALIFEHAGTGRCFENAARMVGKYGHLAVVLQLPSESTHTRYRRRSSHR